MPGESSIVSSVVMEEVLPPVVTDDYPSTELERSAVSEERLDFIGSSAAVKDLFALPYTVMDRSIAVAVHNMGGTLLIDAADPVRSQVASPSLPVETSDVVNAKKVPNVISLKNEEETALTLVHSMIQAEPSNVVKVTNAPASNPVQYPASVPDDVVAQYIPPSLQPREYLSWKFQDLNLLIASDAVIYRAHPGETENGESSTALVVRVEEAQHLRNLLHVKTLEKQQLQAPRSYAQVVARPALTTSETVKAIMPSLENLDIVPSPPQDSESFLPLVPSPSPPPTLSHRMEPPTRPVVESTNNNTPCTPLNPVSTVLDTYLDNIMANVPQLALCLREKGFMQSVKLLNTDEIPSRLIDSSTLDTSVPFETIQGGPDPADEVFSPQIMEMNAQALLRFLKNNCTKDNATYILRRDVGRTNVQLYDISSISAQRQQKWIWSLAMISYRFAHRLQHLTTDDPMLRRTFRARQRSLLHNTLDLLETLVDMNGHKHESLMAAISENLADTFLVELRTGAEGEPVPEVQSTPAAVPITPPPQAVSSHQPYGNISVDALGKAQDHLVYGIKVLNAVLEKHLRSSSSSSQKKRTEQENRGFSDASDSEDEEDSVPTDERLDPVVMQLFGMHHKLVNVSLRLAEIHLKNYWSSSAMQNLRTAAQRIADSFCFAQLVDHNQGTDTQKWLPRIELQYAWLWEQCGHFARSFAADGQWRDRGHASGDDVVSVLQDVDTAFADRVELNRDGPLELCRFAKPLDALTVQSNGATGFQSLSGLLDGVKPKGVAEVTVEMKQVSLDAAMKRLENQKILQRDERRVLVAAALAYSRVVYVFDNCVLYSTVDETLVTLVRQRLGDACNEIGKVMLNEIRNLLLQRSSEEEELTAWTAEALCSSAEFWFREGLRSFERSHDVRNVALLRCNLCQCYKLRANAIFARQPSPDHAETCLEEATNQLSAAHSALEIRDTDPVTWDMVSGELAATLLVLGVRRRQSFLGSDNSRFVLQSTHFTEGRIIDPMERALRIYEEMGNYGQAAAVHYQLAQFYSKIWTCQRDEARTRAKLAAAFQHYHTAHNYYVKTVRGNESTFCLLCLDLASLFAMVSGEGGLSKALFCCLDTSLSLSPESIASALADLGRRQEWLSTMDTVAASIDERTFQLLKRLAKLDSSDKYKNLYRTALSAKISSKTIAVENPTGDETLDAVVRRLEMVRHVLEAIKQQNP